MSWNAKVASECCLFQVLRRGAVPRLDGLWTRRRVSSRPSSLVMLSCRFALKKNPLVTTNCAIFNCGRSSWQWKNISFLWTSARRCERVTRSRKKRHFVWWPPQGSWWQTGRYVRHKEGLRPRYVRRNQNCLLALVAMQCMLVSRFLCAILAALIPVISTKLQPEVSFPVIYGLR